MTVRNEHCCCMILVTTTWWATWWAKRMHAIFSSHRTSIHAKSMQRVIVRASSCHRLQGMPPPTVQEGREGEEVRIGNEDARGFWRKGCS